MSNIKNLFLRLKRQAPAPDSGMEKALMMLESRMSAIEFAADGIAIAENDGRLSFVNKAFADIYGFSSWQVMIGRKWVDLCGSDIRDTLERDVFSILEEGGIWNGTGTGLRRDGKAFRVSVSIAALPGGGWTLVVRDVTEKLYTEELSRQRLAAIEAAGDGIGIVDAAGNLVYMNQALKALHELDEYEAQDRIGQPWVQLYSEAGQTKIREEVMPALRQAGYWKGESPIMTRSGKIVRTEMSLTLLPDGGLIGTARDITDLIHAEKERAEMEKRFNQAQKMEAVGRLAGGIAHDFNNILAAIMGYAEFLTEDLPKDSTAYRYAESIRIGGAQAREVIDRLLTFSRSQDQKMEIIDLQKKVEETVSLLRAGVPSTIRLDFRPSPEGARTMGNNTLVSQAVMNLCVNACDAIGSGHGLIEVAVRKERFSGLSAEHHVYGDLVMDKTYFTVMVRDNGCGMDKAVVEKIFEPFFTTKAPHHGTGLGLASVHGIMKAHDGAIAVTSTPGKGTEFTLYFPMSKEAQLSRPFETVVWDGDTRVDEGVEILIVDDQQDVRVMLSEMLARLGHRATLCARADEALDRLKEAPDKYNLILTDQTMPGMTGCELAATVERDYPRIPVILMSGYATENLEEMAQGIGSITGILHKPVNRKDIAVSVAQALAGRHRTA